MWWRTTFCAARRLQYLTVVLYGVRSRFVTRWAIVRRGNAQVRKEWGSGWRFMIIVSRVDATSAMSERLWSEYGRLPAKTGSDTSTLKVLWLQVPLPAGIIPTGKFKGTCRRYLRYCIPVAFLNLGYFARSYRESDDLLSTLFMCPVATSGCPITSPPPHSTANAILDLLNLIPRSIQSALLIFLLLLLLLFIASLC